MNKYKITHESTDSFKYYTEYVNASYAKIEDGGVITFYRSPDDGSVSQVTLAGVERDDTIVASFSNWEHVKQVDSGEDNE